MTFPSYSVAPRLIWALVISLAAHAVLLVQDDFQTPNLRLVQPLLATLRGTGVGAVAEPTAMAQEVKVPSQPPHVVYAGPIVHKPVVNVLPDIGRLLPQQQVPAAISATPPLAPGTSSITTTNEAQPGVTASAPSTEGLNAEGLRAYSIALAKELRRFKSYPPRAQEAGWGGTVEVRLLINTAGIVEAVQLAKTSGYRVLDEKALDMMRNAAPRAVIPEVLRGHTFPMTLPIVFTLDDE